MMHLILVMPTLNLEVLSVKTKRKTPSESYLTVVLLGIVSIAKLHDQKKRNQMLRMLGGVR